MNVNLEDCNMLRGEYCLLVILNGYIFHNTINFVIATIKRNTNRISLILDFSYDDNLLHESLSRYDIKS